MLLLTVLTTFMRMPANIYIHIPLRSLTLCQISASGGQGLIREAVLVQALSDEALQALRCLVTLRELSLSGALTLDGIGMAALRDLPQLRVVHWSLFLHLETPQTTQLPYNTHIAGLCLLPLASLKGDASHGFAAESCH